MEDLNRDVVRAYNRYYRPRGYGGWNMPEYYDGGLDEDDHLRLRQKKAEVNLWDDKKEETMEQD
jgi:hypothetical protein